MFPEQECPVASLELKAVLSCVAVPAQLLGSQPHQFWNLVLTLPSSGFSAGLF